ncbi:hypothetical protein GCM10009530_59540 [Microbispora corallina]|uniref:Lipoprotein n=1 Tax=Microbispora corallina TaxID=83302 RepID=A0ABQ4GAC0_9ACTN|nr:hypothetical protein [Microbispora corallina]GIH43971.1 hypothetical protein Mco01_69710 [Microbispora corallina]
MRVATVLVGAAVALAVTACGADAPGEPSGVAKPAASAGAPAASANPAASGDTVALGTLVADGQPRPDIPVFAVAWPKSDELDKIQEGADVPTKVVARGRTDAGGRFQLRLDPASIDPLYKEDAGDVQMEIVVESEGGPSWQFTATQGDEGWSTADAEPGKDRPFEARLEVDAATGELKVQRLDTTVSAEG